MMWLDEEYYLGVIWENKFPDCHSVDHLLGAVIAADYLLADSWTFSDQVFCACLARILLNSRRSLTLDHISLVQTHPVFVRKNFRADINDITLEEVMADAAIKPYLQENWEGLRDDRRSRYTRFCATTHPSLPSTKIHQPRPCHTTRTVKTDETRSATFRCCGTGTTDSPARS